MSRVTWRRRLSIALAISVLAGLWAVGSAAAFVPPSDGNSSCVYQNAGYYPASLWDPTVNDYLTVYRWDGSLQWQMCVLKTSTGTRYAEIQLSAPVTSSQYDRFTGAVYVELQGCVVVNAYTKYFTTLAQGYVGYSGYNVAGKAGRYYFTPVLTPKSSKTANGGYRVWIGTGAANVVPRSLGAAISLSSDGPQAWAEFTTACKNP